MKRILFACITWLFLGSLLAQPANDDCIGLINLGVAPICPHPDTFNNVNATLSTIFSDPAMNIPTCFNGIADRDVWFQFTSPMDILDFTITITGVDGPNGSVVQPQVAVYRGDCLLDELSELFCAAAPAGANELSFDLIGLDPLENYFLRINDWSATAAVNSGDFVICVDEVDPIFTMGDQTSANTCSGTLYDSGGPDNDYANSENFTFTICPDVPTNCINIELVDFNIEATYDFLTFYDGPDINSPQIASLTGNTFFPIQAGNSCITVQFTSDFSQTTAGFELNWSCSSIPCETTLIPCLETVAIPGLPFTSNNETTCNSGDDISNGPCTANDPLLEGEDFIYTYQSFNDACLDISLAQANLNTSLSIYSDCPESPNAECLGFAQNDSGDSLAIYNFPIDAFQTIYMVISNGDGCTDFDFQMAETICPQFAAARSSCEDALILNTCAELPELFSISQQPNLNPDFFQTGINDGCWPGVGVSHYSWLFFQAQADGEFGFLIDNSTPNEATNINIQVWGPITDYDDLCTFMSNNQPARSTGALNTNSNLTGLINLNPLDNSPITDECEGIGGDGFITPLPVTNELFYLILINDFDGNIVNGGMALDFSPTTPGVLDGLPEDTPLLGQDYTLIGDAGYYTENFDFSCIEMTANETVQLSCVWAENQIDFSQPFSNTITIYLGDNDGGADGICMVYHNSVMGNDVCGIAGEGIGAAGIDNSFIIEFDTWQNGNLGDPFQDHIAVNVNGDMGAPISGPIILPNIENGQEHAVTFNWDPATMTYELIFDGVLLITDTYDIIQNSFQGNSMVYCGFTGSTGAATNLQYVCTGDNKYPTAVLDSLSIQICEGESVFLGGAEQTTSGFYTDFFTAVTGCDSTVVTELMVFPNTMGTDEATICEGESIFIGGAEQTVPGIYTDTLISSVGCDSIVNTTLNVLPDTLVNQEIIICEGESFFAGGNDQTQGGIYFDNFISTNGCDSIVRTDLVVLLSSNSDAQEIICEGASFFVGGEDQTTSGFYRDTLANSIGCDSIITTELVVIETEIFIEMPGEVDCTPQNNCLELNASNSISGIDVAYNWTTTNGEIQSGGTTQNPTVCGPGIYLLEITNNSNGLICIALDSVEVFLNTEVVCDTFDFPNAFSPNGDNLSDVFELHIEGEAYTVTSLKIFNRWGKIVHEGNGNTHAWDGTHNDQDAPSDVYFFLFEILNTDTQEMIVESGDLTLIR